MKSLILVMAGGGVGAGLRYLLGRAFSGISISTGLPWGTFSANIIGGLAMGVLIGWLSQGGALTDKAGAAYDLRLLLGVGLLGGFTTFSAFSLEMALMIQRGDAGLAFGYAAASVLLALGAVFAGLLFGRMVMI